ncbi:hypothetical protein [Labilibaculum manganireducens]|uniref:hypothetical protein n=1 Tax=Labilibaculum manganireducens TaxID=1940525 RepID=UPI0029F485D9|nr:hypothetical protein [Labilibaculum manganireducens]
MFLFCMLLLKKNPLFYTEIRIYTEKNLGFDTVRKLIFLSDLIDDSAEGKVQENFKERSLLFASYSFPDWRLVLEFFSAM